MEWNFDNVKYNGKDLDRVQVDGVTVWEKEKVEFYNYLGNTASARLNTGIKANNNTRLEFKLWSNRTDSFYALGTRQTQNGSHLFSLTGSMIDQSVMFGVGTTTSRVPNLTRITSGYTYEGWFESNGDMTFSWYIKDIGTNTEYSKSNIEYSTSLADNSMNIYLFSNGFQNISTGLRLYYVKIYQDGVLVRDFKPAKINNVSGFYDEVSRTLFTTNNIAVG